MWSGVAFCIGWQLAFLKRSWSISRWHFKLQTTVPFKIAILQSEVITCWILSLWANPESWVHFLLLREWKNSSSVVWSGKKLLDVCGTLFSTGSWVLNWTTVKQTTAEVVIIRSAAADAWWDQMAWGIKGHSLHTCIGVSCLHAHCLCLLSFKIEILCVVFTNTVERNLGNIPSLAHARYEWFTWDIIIW